jgi:hypothetical protein
MMEVVQQINYTPLRIHQALHLLSTIFRVNLPPIDVEKQPNTCFNRALI